MTATSYDCHIRMTPRLQEAIAERKERITSRFPTTTFEQYQGEDPVGICLIAIVDIDDLEEVDRLYLDRMVDLQVEERLPLFVVPESTPERNRAINAEQDAARHLRSAS